MNLNQIRNIDVCDPMVSLRDDLADELDIVDCMPAMSNRQKRQGDELIAELFPTLKPPDPFESDVHPNPDGSLTPKNAPKLAGKPTLRVGKQGSISRDVVGGDLIFDGWHLDVSGWVGEPSGEEVAQFVFGHACLPLQWIHDKTVVFQWGAARGLRKPDAANESDYGMATGSRWDGEPECYRYALIGTPLEQMARVEAMHTMTAQTVSLPWEMRPGKYSGAAFEKLHEEEKVRGGGLNGFSSLFHRVI